MRALDGVHVLDLSLLLPGPLCGAILRDLGARVTKVEPPFPGDYMALWPPMVGPVSAPYWALNRGKSVVSLNLKENSDRDRFLELAATADVVIDGFRPGVLDKLGVGYQKLSERNPAIVLCSISGYGQTGPMADRAGHDLNYQALAGVLSVAGGERPANPQLQAADTAGGSYAAAMLVLAALLERAKTGCGRHIDVSMSEQLLPLLIAAYATSAAQEQNPARDRELLSGRAPCYRVYRTSDGKYFSVGALEPKFWQALVVALDDESLAEGSHLGDDEWRETVVARLEAIFATKTRDQWQAIFDQTDACCEGVLDFDEVVRHPQWQARQSFLRLAAPDGRTMALPKLPGSLAGFDTDDNQTSAGVAEDPRRFAGG